MEAQGVEIQVKGKAVAVPSVMIDGRTVIVTGKWLKTAIVQDEDFLEGQVVDKPEMFVGKLKESGIAADVFSFTQKLPRVKPRFMHYFEWDNVAAIPLFTYEEWWDKQISGDLRKDIRRSEKRGVVVKTVPFTDEFVRAIMEIYNDNPIRQGRTFWHYGKDFDSVKRENATYLSQSEFIAAYYNDEPIGFIKVVFLGDLACLMQIISKASHHDKWPTNALIAKAVEVSVSRECSYLTYGKYDYGKKTKSTLADFKRRNGFERILVPRYFVPLSAKGKLAMALGLHRGIKNVIPSFLLDLMARMRSRRVAQKVTPSKPDKQLEINASDASIPR